MLSAQECEDIKLGETLYLLNNNLGSITPCIVVGAHPISGGNYKTFDLQTTNGDVYRDVAVNNLFRSFRETCRFVAFA